MTTQKMLRKSKYPLITVVILFAAIIVYWQVDYEMAISKVKKNCVYLKNRERINYTPVVLYKIRSLSRNADCKTDRLIYNAAFSGCSNMQISGYQLMYMAHIYLTGQEKDSLVRIYNTSKSK